jgi:hypothetical protein
MKPQLILIPALLAVSSCDKAKQLAEKAASTAKEQIAAKTGGDDNSKADPELKQLVDQTAEGVIFRKDLPFPSQLEVLVTRSQKWSGRVIRESAIERTSEALQGTRISVSKLERAGNRIRHTIEESGFSIPSAEDSENANQMLADPFKSISSGDKSSTFIKQGDTWRADPPGEFRSASLAQDLSPFFDALLVENALAPRPLWFSNKKRFNPGDQLAVAGASLPMLLSGDASGSLMLTLESFDAVDGHPCAVFSVTGDYSRKSFPDFEGVFTDEEVTIESGKIWLSLIHPLILREELDTVQTIKSGPGGSQSTRGQGSIQLSVKRSWKPL